MKRFYTGPFEGRPAIKPPALPEDIYSLFPSGRFKNFWESLACGLRG